MRTTLRRAATIAIALFCGITSVPNSHAGTNEDAVTFRTNPAHTGQATMPDLTLPLQKKWDVALSGTVSYPIIAGGRIFVIAHPSSTSSGSSGQLYALDPTTGSVVWGPVTLPNSTFNASALAYENGRVFVAQDQASPSVGGLMLAYDAATGTALWSTTYSGQGWSQNGPTALNGFVYAQEAGNVSCIRESDGALMWSNPQGETEVGGLAVTPNAVYVAGACGQTYRLDPSTGAIIWHLSTGCSGGGGSTCSYYNSAVYILDYYTGTSSNTDAALDAATGSVTKTFPNQGWLAFDNGLMFGTINNAITATNLTTWNSSWTVNHATDPPVTAPTVVNGIVYLATQSGAFVGYDEKTGNQVVNLSLGETPSSTIDSTTDMAAGDGIILVPAGTHLVEITSQFTLSSLTPQKVTVIGSVPVTYQVNLSKPAPTGGAVAALSTTNPNVSIPASVTVPAGKQSASFIAATLKTTRPVTGLVSATFNGVTLNSTITVSPDGVQSFTITPNPVAHGAKATGQITLNYAAPAGGVTISLSSSLLPIVKPEVTSITIPAGSTTGTFLIDTAVVLSNITETVKAQVSGNPVHQASITLTP